MSASAQTLRQPRRIGAPAALILTAVLLALAGLVILVPRASELRPAAGPAPAVSVTDRLSPGAAATGRHGGSVFAETIRPTAFREGSVKTGTPAGFVPPHGSGDFRGGAARSSGAVASTQAGGSVRPIEVGGFTCHQCR